VGRLVAVYALFAAILVATAGLAFYSYRYSAELSHRDRLVIMDTMRDLADEKRLGIEAEIHDAEKAVFNSVDIDDLVGLRERLKNERPAVESVLVLDQDLAIVPDGFFVRSRPPDEVASYRQFLERRVIPELDLRGSPYTERRSGFLSYDGRPYLFAWIKKSSRRRVYYVLIEDDLNYLVAVVFPSFFQGITAKRLYQVVDDRGDLVYGFEDIPRGDVVEEPFADMSTWRLRVAQRDRTPASPTTRRLADLVVIGISLLVIVSGFVFLVLAVRRERRANQLKSEFISNVSHELKTPLSIISMFGELLSMGRTSSPEQSREYAEIIRRESARLSRLIDNVLDFAKLERGVEVFEFAEGDVGEVVERAAELTGHRLDRAGMTMSVDIEPELPLVRLDANAMTLAVLNLLDNAMKYAADGKRIEVGLHRRDERIVLEVRDFGPGIAADEQDAIFDRFYRARAVRLKPIRGSGIGLALVKRIAEAHGGDVTVTSAPDQGASFRLWIPCRAGRVATEPGLNREPDRRHTSAGGAAST